MSDEKKRLYICCGKAVTYAGRLDYATLTCRIFGKNKRIQDAAEKRFRLKADLTEK